MKIAITVHNILALTDEDLATLDAETRGKIKDFIFKKEAKLHKEIIALDATTPYTQEVRNTSMQLSFLRNDLIKLNLKIRR